MLAEQEARHLKPSFSAYRGCVGERNEGERERRRGRGIELHCQTIFKLPILQSVVKGKKRNAKKGMKNVEKGDNMHV